MVEFGDELIIDSYRIPWLIWIQLLIFILLLVLLCSFSFFGNNSNPDHSDLSSSSSSSSPPSTSDGTQKQGPGKQDTTTTSAIGCFEIDQVIENQGIMGAISPSTSRRRVRVEENTGREASTSIDPAYIDYHPCHIVRLARIAFLKCLGLDPTAENPSERRKNR